MRSEWISQARERYYATNAETLRWVLDRPLLDGKWINTKMNSITLADYTENDGVRGPGYVYGWIQGRALEALVTHAQAYVDRDPDLASKLNAQARVLYDALAAIQSRDRHVYFCYDNAGTAILPDGSPQVPVQDIYTYSDAFAAKGLVAAAASLGLPELEEHLHYLARVVASIPENRFQMNEKVLLGASAIAAQGEDFGPRMILLGAADMLKRFGLGEHAKFARPFIDHVLNFHVDEVSGLVRDTPSGDACNVGHAIEFVGFALAALDDTASQQLVDQLENVLVAEFQAGFKGPGVVLSVSNSTAEVLDDKCPWWSLPETIRAASLAYERTLSVDCLSIWQQADQAFFENYWRAGTGVAYQTRTPNGPLDFVPATPDLDPGYHTGLSLLGAINVAERMFR
jgi:hypothetical protein